MHDVADVPDEACLADWCAGEEWCAVTCAAAVIENRWHPVVVHRLLERGPLRFNELAAETGASNKVLSESLTDLEANGLVARDVDDGKPVAVEYSLTARGEALRPVVEALAEWGRTHLGADGDRTDC